MIKLSKIITAVVIPLVTIYCLTSIIILLLMSITLNNQDIKEIEKPSIEKVGVKEHPCESSPFKTECYDFERQLGRLK